MGCSRFFLRMPELALQSPFSHKSWFLVQSAPLCCCLHGPVDPPFGWGRVSASTPAFAQVGWASPSTSASASDSARSGASAATAVLHFVLSPQRLPPFLIPGTRASVLSSRWLRQALHLSGRCVPFVRPIVSTEGLELFQGEWPAELLHPRDRVRGFRVLSVTPLILTVLVLVGWFLRF